MTVIVILLLVLVVGVVVFEIISERKAKKEIENMTVHNFENKYKVLVERADQLAIAQFLKRHILFILKHQDEVKAILLKYQINTEVKQDDRSDN